MKRLLTGLLVSLTLFFAACESEEAISFNDENLEDAIREEADVENDKDIYPSDVEDIVDLDLADADIDSIDGLASLEELETLSLEGNAIDDLSPLENLENLEEVNVIGNPATEDDEQVAILDELETEGADVEKSLGEPDGPGGYLWKVEENDTTVYLQGTVHVGDDDMFPMNEAIEDAYTDADVVVPEIDLNDVNPMETQELTQEIGMYHDGSDIQDHIPENLYSDLQQTLDDLGLPIAAAKDFKPWMISNLVQQLMNEEIGMRSGVDEYFLNRAETDNKEVIPLETVEEQLSIFAETSEELQIAQLEEALVDIDEYEKEMQELLTLYKKGDKDEMLEALTEDETEIPDDVDESLAKENEAFMQALNDDRNEGMAEDIQSFLEEDDERTYFVIVGTLHLIMEPHVRSFLEEEGYDIEQVL